MPVLRRNPWAAGPERRAHSGNIKKCTETNNYYTRIRLKAVTFVSGKGIFLLADYTLLYITDMRTPFRTFCMLVVALASLLWMTMACTTSPSSAESLTADDAYVYADLPFDMPRVERPAFPDYEVRITDFGARGDGVTCCTEAIRQAIETVHGKGGGRVVVPAGVWLTGPIELLSNVCLHTEQNALVVFTDDFEAYPIVDTSFEGLDTRRCQSPLWARQAENIAITGHGVFDGSGDGWRPVKKSKLTASQWKALVASGGVVEDEVWYPAPGSLKGARACQSFNNPVGIETDEEWDEIRPWLRPVLLSLIGCKRVLLEDVTFKNSPAWCLHPLSCEHLTINRVKVFNPWYSQNGDALDLESCRYVLVTRCTFDAGDDAICIKSGKDADGRLRGQPCQYVVVKDNVVLHGHGGFVVGSEMSGGVKNIYVSNCTFLGTDVGLRFKSTRGRGGVVEAIYIDRINMLDIPHEALLFDLFYGGKAAGEETAAELRDRMKADVPPVTEETPAFRNIHISNIVCRGAGRAMLFNGLPEMPITDISVSNVVVTEAREGIVLSQTRNVSFDSVRIDTPGEVYRVAHTANLTIDGHLH